MAVLLSELYELDPVAIGVLHVAGGPAGGDLGGGVEAGRSVVDRGLEELVDVVDLDSQVGSTQNAALASRAARPEPGSRTL